MRTPLRAAAVAAALACFSAWAAGGSGAKTLTPSAQAPGTIGRSLANEADAAVDRGLDWLASRQKEDGSWSNPDFPALTALPLLAFVRGEHPRKAEIVDKAVGFILSCVQDDGGIYRKVPDRKGGGLSNYNTAICMRALHAVGRPSLVPVVQRARQFITGSQLRGGDVYRGGFGYDRETGRSYTDLLNTFYTVEAMRLTQDVEDLRPEGAGHAGLDWDAARKYIESMQNTAAAGTNDAGGFFYKPGESKAGATTNDAGKVVFRSYGSITYAGLLAMIYADISRDDARVRSAFDWSARHWSLEENPGMGTEGLYFFYDVLARALDAYGQDLIPRPNGKPVDWRAAVIRKLVSLQRIDPATGRGYWVNDTGRFWENDPVLATSYSLLALQDAL